jgi:hypothetical protein
VYVWVYQFFLPYAVAFVGVWVRVLLFVFPWPVLKYKFFVGVGVCIGLYTGIYWMFCTCFSYLVCWVLVFVRGALWEWCCLCWPECFVCLWVFPLAWPWFIMMFLVLWTYLFGIGSVVVCTLLYLFCILLFFLPTIPFQYLAISFIFSSHLLVPTESSCSGSSHRSQSLTLN